MNLILSFLLLVSAETIYKKPEPMIDSLLRAESFSTPIINRQKTALLKAYSVEMPSIGFVARPRVKLGGAQFNPQNYTSIGNNYISRLVHFDMKTSKDVALKFPKDSVIRDVQWSPDGKHISVSIEKESCHEVWMVSVPGFKISRVPGVCLSAVLGRTIIWIDGDSVLLGTRSARQTKELSVKKEVPSGPVVQEVRGEVSQNRTFPDLLKTEQDKKNFALAVESQLVIYRLGAGSKSNVGVPSLYMGTDVSPNSKLLLVNKIEKPFSVVVPFYLFAKSTQVLSLDGQMAYELNKSGPFERLPIQGVPTGPRSYQWIGSEPQSLMYVTALDKGDWAVKTEFRDELFRLKIPESSGGKLAPESLLKVKNRFSGALTLNQPDTFLVFDYEREKEWSTTMLLTNKSGWGTKTVFSMSVNDDYKDPGSPVMVYNKYGRRVVAIDGESAKSIYFSGEGATPEGARPFLRKMDLATFAMDELFRSEPKTYESFATFLTDDYSKFLTSYQSQTESPRYFVRKPKDKAHELLYADPNPFEIFAKIKKEIVTYKRDDGTLLSGILYYPLNYEAGKKYPAIIQAYPLEYTDAKVAGQVRGSSDQFARPSRADIVYQTLRGYIVLDEAQMPIIGAPETKNDTFIEQLVSDAKAAVKMLKKRDLVDEKHIGVIGHSYGAFMVAHLLTHSDLFATGVARSGAYNRTLTPFGFQGERRPLWKAESTYIKMSPFMDVEKMKKPILLVHGMADDNPGTFTLQSERYFEALKGQGAQAKLLLLPEESHGYAAIESNAHLLAETSSWFDQYLKDTK